MESLLVQEEVLQRHIGIIAEKGHNFLSDCWIALKNLHEFSKPVFQVVPKESHSLKSRFCHAIPE